jgi:hypothetical protein
LTATAIDGQNHEKGGMWLAGSSESFLQTNKKKSQGQTIRFLFSFNSTISIFFQKKKSKCVFIGLQNSRRYFIKSQDYMQPF